jgi:hypothetical protein
LDHNEIDATTMASYSSRVQKTLNLIIHYTALLRYLNFIEVLAKETRTQSRASGHYKYPIKLRATTLITDKIEQIEQGACPWALDESTLELAVKSDEITLEPLSLKQSTTAEASKTKSSATGALFARLATQQPTANFKSAFKPIAKKTLMTTYQAMLPADSPEPAILEPILKANGSSITEPAAPLIPPTARIHRTSESFFKNVPGKTVLFQRNSSLGSSKSMGHLADQDTTEQHKWNSLTEEEQSFLVAGVWTSLDEAYTYAISNRNVSQQK